MPWSKWIELSFREDGSLDMRPLTRIPCESGIYAIASKKQTELFVTHYVGRSSRSMRERLVRHLSGRGNKVIAAALSVKRDIPSAPMSVFVAYLESTEPKIVEAIYLDATDLPVCNIYRACLPAGLSEILIRHSELER